MPTKLYKIDKLLDADHIKAQAIADSYNSMCGNFLYPLFRKNTIFDGIVRNRKGGKENNDEFGFYHNECIYPLIQIVKHFGISSIADLGSGPGIIMDALRTFNSSISVMNYENESVMVRTFMHNTIIKKDITILTWEDIAAKQALYFYEPLVNLDLCKKFADNLAAIIPKNEDKLLIYRPSGQMGAYIEATKRFKNLGYHHAYTLFKAI